MSSLNRIKASAIQLGNSYIFGETNKSTASGDESASPEDEAILPYKNQANGIIANAEAEAQKILEEAAAQASEIIRQAQEEGYKSGYELGYAEAKSQLYNDMSNQINSVKLLANSAFKVKKEIISSSELEILQLSITIAEKVIKQQLEINPDILLNIIKAAINELKDKEEVKIHINPVHKKNLYSFSDELTGCINGLEKIKIIEDKTIPVDGLIVESMDSRIDASLNTQISEITRQIMEEASNSPILEEIPKEIEIKIQEPPIN